MLLTAYSVWEMHESSAKWRRLALIIGKVMLFVALVMGILAAAISYLVWVPHYHRLPEDPSVFATLNDVHFLALGDQGSGMPAQWLVARSMERVAQQQGRLDFVTLLGDNFYPCGIYSSTQSEWVSHFENVYQGKYLDAVPFFAVLGNHDHLGNPEAELDDARQRLGSGRWRMPSWYYSQDFGTSGNRPLPRIVFIDTVRSPEDLAEEAAFIEQQFAESPTSVSGVLKVP